MNNFSRYLLCVFVFFSFFVFGGKNIEAQTCAGSINCCVQSNTTVGPPGCVPLTCAGQPPGCQVCTTTSYCSLDSGFNCVMTNGSPANCINPSTTCLSDFPTSGSCYFTETCPPGESFCGGCIGDCRSTATQTCAQQIAAECTGDTGTSDPPTSPPGCSATCSAPYCGQPNNCGGFCSTSDGVRFLPTPVIVDPVENQTFTFPSSVLINWPAIPNADSGYRVKIEKVIPGENTLVHDANNVMQSQYTWTTISEPGTYRAKVKAKQDLCPNSEWSQWVKFTVAEDAPSCSVTLTPNPITITAGSTTQITANVTPVDGTVTSVAFSIDNPAVATLNPASDSVTPYRTVATGVAGGTASVTATATVTSPSGTLTATCSTTGSATTGQITGRLCQDDRAAYSSNGSTCTVVPNGCTPYIPQEGETVTLRRGATTYPPVTVNSFGIFNFNVPANTGYIASLSSDDPLNSCVCPGGCEFTSVTSPNTSLNFYYRPALERDPWWQVMGGHVYAGGGGGTSLYSGVPTDSCEIAPAPYTCNPHFITRDKAGSANSSGAIVTAGGDVDVNQDSGIETGNIDEDGREMRVRGATLSRYLENYDYFFRQYSMAESNQDLNSATLTKPSGAPTNGRAYLRNANATIAAPWTVNSGQSYVIFIDGDLTINSTIDVAEGGFLAFIVSGDVTIAQTVCQADFQSTDGVVEGVFVASGRLTIEGDGTTDCKFVGEGMFIAHEGVYLERDYQDDELQSGYNGISPVELFVYRPDIMLNVPERMKRPLYQWQEVLQ